MGGIRFTEVVVSAALVESSGAQLSARVGADTRDFLPKYARARQVSAPGHDGRDVCPRIPRECRGNESTQKVVQDLREYLGF
jgi:hypothetical protein